jgi:hypothetical protein
MMSKPHADRHWSGHFPVTSTALLSILERAARGETRFSALERRFYLACEVWAGVNAGELDALFAAGVLGESPAAFLAIGAERVAEVLRRSLMRPINGSSTAAQLERIAALTDDLQGLPEPVDELLARCARGFFRAAPRSRESAPQFPQTAAG